MDDSSGIMGQILSALGPLAFLGWYLFHDVKYTRPEREKRFADAIENLANKFRAEQAAEREENLRSINRLDDRFSSQDRRYELLVNQYRKLVVMVGRVVVKANGKGFEEDELAFPESADDSAVLRKDELKK